jgi:hypothetical protein
MTCHDYHLIAKTKRSAPIIPFLVTLKKKHNSAQFSPGHLKFTPHKKKNLKCTSKFTQLGGNHRKTNANTKTLNLFVILHLPRVPDFSPLLLLRDVRRLRLHRLGLRLHRFVLYRHRQLPPTFFLLVLAVRVAVLPRMRRDEVLVLLHLAVSRFGPLLVRLLEETNLRSLLLRVRGSPRNNPSSA